jgi:hypothetical protein
MAPDDVARQFFREVADGDWNAAAAELDPESAEQFRRQALRSLLSYAKARAARANNGPMNLAWSTMADTIIAAPYDTASIVTRADSTTLGALAHLGPMAFVARALEANYQPSIGQTQYTVIGYVAEGESLAHVVFRRDFGGSHLTGEAAMARSLMHLRRVDGSWKILPQDAVLQATGLLNQAVQYRMQRMRSGR